MDRQSPHGAGTRPTHRLACRKDSGSAHRQRSTDPQPAMNLPAEKETADLRGGTRSCRRRRSQRACQLLDSTRAIVSGRPVRSERLCRCGAVQSAALALEPAPHSNIVVRPGKIVNDEDEKMKTIGNRIRRGAAARHVASRTGFGDADQTGKQFQAQNVVENSPLVRECRRLVYGVDDLHQEAKTLEQITPYCPHPNRGQSRAGRGSRPQGGPLALRAQRRPCAGR